MTAPAQARADAFATAPSAPHEPEAVTVEVDGVPLSGLVCEVPQPRAVILAVHGGATTSAYFDCPGRPRNSLLRTAAALGFTTIALDRPGYAASAPHAEEFYDPDRRVRLGYGAVDALLTGRQVGAGLFLWAHSNGTDLALRMAVAPRGDELLGLELAGTGLRHQPEAGQILTARRHGQEVTREEMHRLRDIIWHPPRLFPPELFGGAGIGAPAPLYEGTVSDRWPQDFPRLAARIDIPVHFSAAQYEEVWEAGATGLAEIAALFTAAPRVVVAEQAESGHNLSVGWAAMAYHLKILSFVDECVQARLTGPPAPDTP